MMPPRISSRRRRGFTLIEAIMVIVITGIIAGMVALFIRLPVQGYVDATARADLSDVADLAMRRMTRDIRLALPNSVRWTQIANVQYLEMLETSGGGRYLDASDGINNPGTYPGNYPPLDFITPANTSFYVVGTMPQIVPGNYIAVYNLGAGFAPADSYAGGNLAKVASIASGNLVNLQTNPFAAQPANAKMGSPSFRFQVVTMPVTYVCTPDASGAGNGSVMRYWGYAIQEAQPTTVATLTSATSGAVLANRVTSCNLQYSTLTTTQAGLVELTLGMQVPGSNSGAVTLTQEVQVDNTP